VVLQPFIELRLTAGLQLQADIRSLLSFVVTQTPRLCRLAQAPVVTGVFTFAAFLS
jgi:hypothetical protein